jgi:hypothetical protein
MPTNQVVSGFPEEGEWQYRAVFTNLSTSAGSIGIGFDIPAGSRLL